MQRETDREADEDISTHLFSAIDELIAPLFWEIFLHHVFPTALEMSLSLVLVLTWNTIQYVVLNSKINRRQRRFYWCSPERLSSFLSSPSSSSRLLR